MGTLPIRPAARGGPERDEKHAQEPSAGRPHALTPNLAPLEGPPKTHPQPPSGAEVQGFVGVRVYR